jgi:hypothetical protein
MSISPEWLGQLVVEGLVIVGWIALWHPVDMLCFDRLPLLRDKRVLVRVQQAQITLVARHRGRRLRPTTRRGMPP